VEYPTWSSNLSGGTWTVEDATNKERSSGYDKCSSKLYNLSQVGVLKAEGRIRRGHCPYVNTNRVESFSIGRIGRSRDVCRRPWLMSPYKL
jgi:hypothetical protein